MAPTAMTAAEIATVLRGLAVMQPAGNGRGQLLDAAAAELDRLREQVARQAPVTTAYQRWRKGEISAYEMIEEIEDAEPSAPSVPDVRLLNDEEMIRRLRWPGESTLFSRQVADRLEHLVRALSVPAPPEATEEEAP